MTSKEKMLLKTVVNTHKLVNNKLNENQKAELLRLISQGYKKSYLGVGLDGSIKPLLDINANLQSDAYIASYHSGKRYSRPDSRFAVGVEIERKYLSSSYYQFELAYNQLTIENDSSCGYEFITKPIELENKKLQEYFSNYVFDKIFSEEISNSCGGHIHLSDKLRNPTELLNDMQGYLPLLYSLYPSRADNSYSRANKLAKYYSSDNRGALNITDETLEFRIFPVIKNKEQLLWRLKLVKLMALMPRRYNKEVISDLKSKNSKLSLLLSEILSQEQINSKLESINKYSQLYSTIIEHKANKTIIDKMLKDKTSDDTIIDL